jgi:hypothetical protein
MPFRGLGEESTMMVATALLNWLCRDQHAEFVRQQNLGRTIGAVKLKRLFFQVFLGIGTRVVGMARSVDRVLPLSPDQTLRLRKSSL